MDRYESAQKRAGLSHALTAARIAEVAFAVPVRSAFHYLVPESLDVKPGMRIKAPFGPHKMVGTVLSVFKSFPTRPLKFLTEVLDPQPLLDGELIDCARWMSRRYSAPIGECVRSILPAFLKAGKIPETAAEGAESGRPHLDPGWDLTSGQSQALSRLSDKLQERRYAARVLFGVPASGKTEVYLRLIREALDLGGQALFLLPEISLTHPFFEEFTARLPGAKVALWHSRLGQRARRQTWLGLRDGSIGVVIGARSACLLAFRDLRIAVLDEEQDESFKQEGQSPFYHARDVVLQRARAVNALVVLGSATPSLEVWEMARRGDAELIEMPDRVSSVGRPDVGVVASPSFGRCLSEGLLDKLKDRLSRKEQSILLVNRRGFSTLILCPKCGWVDRCPSCGVARVEHQDGQASGGYIVRCHHCTGTGPSPAQCPQCANVCLRKNGVGTQRVVSELKRALPGVRVLRMDRDTLSKEGKHETKIYERFKSREADVLVGTKLVAKSFHFPEVTLVGVIDADTMLHMPDFRACERTMQLVAQVAGRSGRADKKGEVLLQSAQPTHGAIAGAVTGDYALFAKGELEFRRELGYPPYGTLIRLLWSGKDDARARAAAETMSEHLRGRFQGRSCSVIGPAPAVLRRLGGKFRHHLLLKAETSFLEQALAAVHSCEKTVAVKLKIDVDPYDLF